MISLLSQNNCLQQTTQSRIDTMDEIDYAFYLAYGMTQEEEQLDSLLDVEMYNILPSHMQYALEASHGDVFHQDAQAA